MSGLIYLMSCCCVFCGDGICRFMMELVRRFMGEFIVVVVIVYFYFDDVGCVDDIDELRIFFNFIEVYGCFF